MAHSTLKSASIATIMLAGLGLMVLSSQPAQAKTTSCADGLGTVWNGCEYGQYCSWSFKFVRRGCSRIWDASWWATSQPGFSAPVAIWREGNTVKISRSANAGGVACDYTGTIKNPVYTINNITGTYSCNNGYVGPWRASSSGK